MAAVSGCARVYFLIFNVIFWVVGLGVLGYVSWQLATSTAASDFWSGSLYFTYSLLAVGIFITFAGLIGCIGGCAESTCCLKTYVAMATTLLLVDIGVGVAGAIRRDNVLDLAKDLWNELNQETKDHIQEQLSCCGYNGTAAYGSSIPCSCYDNCGNETSIYTMRCCAYSDSTAEYGTNLPTSCYVNSDPRQTQYPTTCGAAMEDWMRDNIPIWAAILGGTLFIQLLCMLLGCCVLKKVEYAMKVGAVDN